MSFTTISNKLAKMETLLKCSQHCDNTDLNLVQRFYFDVSLFCDLDILLIIIRAMHKPFK